MTDAGEETCLKSCLAVGRGGQKGGKDESEEQEDRAVISEREEGSVAGGRLTEGSCRVDDCLNMIEERRMPSVPPVGNWSSLGRSPRYSSSLFKQTEERRSTTSPEMPRDPPHFSSTSLSLSLLLFSYVYTPAYTNGWIDRRANQIER